MEQEEEKRQTTHWLDNIETHTKMNIPQLKGPVLDKVGWKALAYNVTKSRT